MVLQGVDSLPGRELIDSLTSRLDAAASQLGAIGDVVRDSLNVRVIAQPFELWPVIASVALPFVLVLVTWYYQRKSTRLHGEVKDLQARANDLQHDYNVLVKKQEGERLEREAAALVERQKAINARISAVAYALERQLRS